MSKKSRVGRIIFVISTSANGAINYVADTEVFPARCKVLAIVEDTGKITFVGNNTADTDFDGNTLAWHISGCVRAIQEDGDAEFGRKAIPPQTLSSVEATTS